MSLLCLPPPLLIEIGCYLPYDNISAFAQAHPYLTKAVWSEKFWIKRYQQDFYFLLADKLLQESGQPFTYYHLCHYLYFFINNIKCGIEFCSKQRTLFHKHLHSYEQEPTYFASWVDRALSWDPRYEADRVSKIIRIGFMYGCPPFAFVDFHPRLEFEILLQVTFYSQVNKLCVIVEIKEKEKDAKIKELQEMKIRSLVDIDSLFERARELGYLPLAP